jgi:hypothetical protein
MNEITQRYQDDPDLPLEKQRAILLLHASSPAVINNDPPGARAGMFVGLLGGELVLFSSFVFVPVGFTLTFPQFTLGQKAPVNDDLGEMPREAVFYLAGQGGKQRAGHYLPNGDQVVETVTAYMLVEHDGRLHPSAFRFAHVAYPIGRQFGARAAARKAIVEGETVRGCTVGRYEMRAALETKNGRTYYVARPVFLGAVGEPSGSPLPQYRFAEELRAAFKRKEDWALLEPPEPPEPEKVIVEEPIPEADPPPRDDEPGDIDPNDEIPR